MLRSQPALAAFAEQAREKPLGMVECPDGCFLSPVASCATCKDTGLVREPCPTCAAVQGIARTFDPACPDCKDGLAPRVVEVDYTPRRECAECYLRPPYRGTIGQHEPTCMDGCADRGNEPSAYLTGCPGCDVQRVPCPARCDDGWLGWDEAPICVRCGEEGAVGICRSERCTGAAQVVGGPPDLTPLLKPRCPASCGGTGLVCLSKTCLFSSAPCTDLTHERGPCDVCQGRGYLDPLCDVIRLRGQACSYCGTDGGVCGPDGDNDGPCDRCDWHEVNTWHQQCAEVGVALEIREVSRGTR